MAEDILLEVKEIEKSFSGVKVLKGVEFQLRKGEVHALCGENGAGKSTLMNIIDGVLIPDKGTISVNGKNVTIKSPNDAAKLGIGLVHQEVALCPEVSVAENIFMAQLNNRKKVTVNYNELYKKAAEILKPLEKIDPKAKVGELSVSKQQVVEIAKALSMDCKILIFDEPTAALTENETKALFKIIRELKAKGIGIIYISHRMAEVFGECDRVSILRDGVYIGTYDIKETNPVALVNKMVGREIGDIYPPKRDIEKTGNQTLLEVKGLSDGKRFSDISFTLNRGEILGFAGLVGAGRSEVAQSICRLRPRTSGTVSLNGKEVQARSAADSIKEGIVYLTEDRKIEGLFLDLNINQNVSAMRDDTVSKNGLMDKKKEAVQGASYIQKMAVKCRGGSQRVGSLSGGNQQKVLISKLLTAEPKVLIMDEPTRGIDVGAKSEIHKLLRSLANEGLGIILISSELPEVVGMSDRVVVMHEGSIRGVVEAEEINESVIIQLASAVK